MDLDTVWKKYTKTSAHFEIAFNSLIIITKKNSDNETIHYIMPPITIIHYTHM